MKPRGGARIKILAPTMRAVQGRLTLAGVGRAHEAYFFLKSL